MMNPWEHQIELAEKGYEILKKHAIVYFAMEERTGKSLTALLTIEKTPCKNILIITKKGKPMDGWHETISNFSHLLSCEYTIINYHSVAKIASKGPFDLVILDEAHNYISGFPKVSAIYNAVKKLTKGLPLIYISATPYAQTPALLYHQFALSNWSPWNKYSNYYNWWRTYGTGESKWIGSGRQAKCYELVKDDLVLTTCEHLFITKTRKELGFEHEPKDKLHYIELSKDTKKVYNKLIKDKLIDNPVEYIADTVTLMRYGLHQLEGGTLKTITIGDRNDSPYLLLKRSETIKDEFGTVAGVKHHNYHVLPNREKLDYILANWGDTKDIAIMYNYIAEGHKLKDTFKKAHILQATTNAEGCDLSGIQHLIIYSQDFSTARHTQRRARQANMERTLPITVHFLLVKDGISEQVYDTVTLNKQNYVDSLFTKKEL